MNHSRDLVLAGNVTTTPDPPSVPMANAQATLGSALVMDGQQLVCYAVADQVKPIKRNDQSLILGWISLEGVEF